MVPEKREGREGKSKGGCLTQTAGRLAGRTGWWPLTVPGGTEKQQVLMVGCSKTTGNQGLHCRANVHPWDQVQHIPAGGKPSLCPMSWCSSAEGIPE